MSVLIEDKVKLQELIEKYGISVPRYTSYPTAPEWKHEYSQEVFEQAISKSNQTKQDYSLYLHIPFCESQCYYCACNVIISPEHGIEDKYITRLKNELSYYGGQIDPARKVSQMAWGGGTPTFLSPDQIRDLYSHIQKYFNLHTRATKSLKELAQAGQRILQAREVDCFVADAPRNDGEHEHEYSIEIDPRVTSVEHLQALYECGFNRLSMGIQDFNSQTQEAINRHQSFDLVFKIVEEARKIGFTSINFDLIYGLPFQTLDTFKDTIHKVKQINPERIALFNYAHIPSLFPFQQKYINEATMPSATEKLDIFARAVQEFIDFGYEFIGIDHFAKPNDALAVAQRNKTLYRNFQGYTTHAGCDLFGFGIASISDVNGVYKQNPKKLNNYYEDTFSADKFKTCSVDDIERREIIKQLMCNNFAIIDLNKYAYEFERLQEFFVDNLLAWTYHDLTKPEEVLLEVTDLGRYFTRNIASVFDTYIRAEAAHKLFSQSL